MLRPTDRDRLLKMLRLLSSDQVGERASAGAAATRLLQDAGVTWDAVIQDGPNPLITPRFEPVRSPPGRADIVWLYQRYSLLTNWEQQFVTSIRRRRLLTGRQAEKLRQVVLDVTTREAQS